MGRRQRRCPLLAVPAAGSRGAAFPGSRGQALAPARGEAVAGSGDEALTPGRGEAVAGSSDEALTPGRGEALAGSGDEALVTARGEAVAGARDEAVAMFQQIARTLVPGLRPALESQLRRPVSAAEERKLVDVIRRTFAGVFPIALFEDELVSVYAKQFSEAEAKALLRFYRTPVGSKAIRVASVLTGEGAAIGERLAQSRQAEFAQRLRDELAHEFSP